MSNLQSVLVLLNLVFQLLSSPQVQSDPALLARVNLFANQAIATAREALADPTATPPVVVPPETPPTVIIPPYNPPQSGVPLNPPAAGGGIGTGATSTPVAPTVAQSCTLSGTHAPDDEAHGIRGNVTLTWSTQGLPDTAKGSLYQAGGQSGGYATYGTPFANVSTQGSKSGLGFATGIYKAIFDGDVKCYAIFASYENTTSTPNLPDGWKLIL